MNVLKSLALDLPCVLAPAPSYRDTTGLTAWLETLCWSSMVFIQYSGVRVWVVLTEKTYYIPTMIQRYIHGVSNWLLCRSTTYGCSVWKEQWVGLMQSNDHYNHDMQAVPNPKRPLLCQYILPSLYCHIISYIITILRTVGQLSARLSSQPYPHQRDVIWDFWFSEHSTSKPATLIIGHWIVNRWLIYILPVR